MSLSTEQLDYIMTAANTRGAAHNLPYVFGTTSDLVDVANPNNAYLNIIVNYPDGEMAGAGTKKGKRGWNTGVVTSDFQALVADCLTTAERHM